MKSFLLMLSFFTRIPFPQMEFTEERYIKGINTLPLVGVIIGAILYIVSFADHVLSGPILGIILYFTYILITGGLHLDGLADSCDALFSGRDRERMLEIMKDSRNGSFGVLGLVVISGAYMALLPQMPREMLLIFPVIGKCAPAISANAASYIREEGMGKLFAENCKLSSAVIAIIFTNAFAFVLAPWLVLAVDIALLSIYIFTKKVKHLLGGITGDVFGLLCEVSQVVFLLVTQILYFQISSS